MKLRSINNLIIM